MSSNNDNEVKSSGNDAATGGESARSGKRKLNSSLSAYVQDSCSEVMSQVLGVDEYTSEDVRRSASKKEANDAMREAYLSVMAPYNSSVEGQDTQECWTQAVENVKLIVDELKESTMKELRKREKEDGEEKFSEPASGHVSVLVKLRDRSDAKLNFSCNDVVIAGRSPYADIPLDCDHYASRVHFVLFCVDDYVVLLDIGSYYGLRTLSRSDADKMLVYSRNGDRSPIVLGRTEKATIFLTPRTTIEI